MKRLLLNLVVIFSIINAGSSISCYNCEGLESVCNKNALILHHDRYLRVCGGNTDRCMRVWQKTDDYEPYVQNICSNERLCDKLEKACKQLEKEGYECAVACCHGEACHLASLDVFFSPYLFIVCIVVGVIQTLQFT
ncbi:uncharacterized protein LOC144634714 isoform X1 [Oculina patagonica]